ncbi:tetratricopeptide repeat protein [Actinacidiphila bryophytorum]|uniref:tetratricopeptide repeat protein n=1 Tax=Actinacidiphila bryophytorum TaxID=1436133 RepID=UPI002176B027|nr:tetratricopeptide repeat protein [Actinacidiphila bryophytorum]UWE10026.1 tetratricopeptide repeat protein [Actinacidiphila bryophytorum]
MPEAARRLAVVLSTATLIEPELIRAARVELRPTLDVGAESALWFGDWASRTGADRMALHQDLLAPLRTLLSAELAASRPGDAIRRVGAVVARAHRGLSPALGLEEQVTWAAVLADAGLTSDTAGEVAGDPALAIDRMLERALRAAVDQPDRREGLRRWFTGAWQRLPVRVRRTMTAQDLYDLLVRETAEDPAVPGMPSPHLLQGVGDVLLEIRHDGKFLTVGDNEWPAEGILVPDTDPRVLHVSPDPADWHSAQRFSVHDGGTAQVGISHVPVYVRNARGIVYHIGAPGSAWPLGDVQPLQDDPDAPPPASGDEAVSEPPEPSSPSAESPDLISVAPPYTLMQGRLYGDGAREILVEMASPGRARRSRVHVVVGIGGSGKSRIALEVAHRHQDRRRVWWVSAPRISESMRQVARELGIPEPQIERAFRGDVSAQDLVWQHLNTLDKPWLLVFDGADEPERLAPRSDGTPDNTGWLREPGTPLGLVLVTSRSRRGWLANAIVYPVRPLWEIDGAALLQDRAPNAGSDEAARSLSTELGGLPAALCAAADYLRSVSARSASPGEVPEVRDFDSYTRAIRSRLRRAPGTAGSGLGESIGLDLMARVCDLSFELLDRTGLPEARRLLKMLAYLGPAPVPYRAIQIDAVGWVPSAFPGIPDAERLPAAVRALADLGLLTVEERLAAGRTPASSVAPEVGELLYVHPLVRGLLRSRDDIRGGHTAYQTLSLGFLESATRSLSPDRPAHWPMWSALVPHTTEVVTAALTGYSVLPPRDTAKSLLALARLTVRFLIAGDRLREAAAFVDPLIAACRSFGYPPDSTEIVQLRQERARITLEDGDPAAAEGEFARIVALRTAELGSTHPLTLSARHLLAWSVLQRGRWAEAESILAALVADHTTALGHEHHDTLTVRHSLVRAVVAQDRGDEVLAEAYGLLEARLRLRQGETYETLRLRQTITRTLLLLGRADEGLAEIEIALASPTLEEDSTAAFSLRFTRIQALLMRGRIEEATAELRIVVEGRTRLLGSDHPEVLRSRRMLGEVEAIGAMPEQEVRASVRQNGPH